MEHFTRIVYEMATLFMGIDLHQKVWQITIRDMNQILFRRRIPGAWEELLKVLERFKGRPMYAVYEAGCFGYELHDLLEAYGVKCIVTPPSLVPMEYGNRVKTDRRDSEKLAYLLTHNQLKQVYVPSKEERFHRQAFRRRGQLVKDRVRVQNRIKSELRFFGLAVPEIRAPFSPTYIANLRKVNFGDRFIQESFCQLLDQYEYLTVCIARQVKLIKELAELPQYAPRVKILTGIRGVGILSAMEIILELHDISRFSNDEKIAAYLGLTPAQYSTGEHIWMGRITRIGKPHLRGTLIEICWTLIRYYPDLRDAYLKLKARAGSKRAIVAIARRFIIQIRHMLLTNTPYRLRAVV